MMAEAKKLHQEIEKFKAEASVGEARQFLMSAKTVGELKVLTASRENVDAATLRQMGDFLKDKEPNVVAVLASTSAEKISFLAVCGKNAIAKGIKAGDLVKNVCTICGGKGGGKPDSAMGGGKDMLKLDDALAAANGLHTHETTCEVIYIISGTGKVLCDGAYEPLAPGACHYCPKGHAHSLINDSDGDLVFFAVVPEQ